MPTVSVIVPVYNVRQFLPRCVKSLQAQTMDDFEVVLVDDGSTDGSSQLCDELASSDSRIKVLHKENGGASSARNYGIDNAEGEYLSFIDADDFIHPSMFSILVNGARSLGAGIATCKNVRVDEGEVFDVALKKEASGFRTFSCTGIDALGFALLGTNVSGSLCDKLILRDLLGDMRFREGVIYEDALLASQLFPRCDKVFVTTRPMYYYTVRSGSATTKPYDNSAYDAVRIYSEISQKISTDYPEIEPQAEFRLLWAYYTAFDRMIASSDYRSIPEYGATLTYLRTHTKRVLRDPFFRVTRKVGAAVLWVNVGAYRQLVLKGGK